MKILPPLFVAFHVWVCLSLPAVHHAQTGIFGVLRNEEGAPSAYANVLLLHAADSSLVKGQISDEEGLFAFGEISAGYYLVRVSLLGYSDLYTEPFQRVSVEQRTDLGILTLTPSSAQLETVNVVARRPFLEQKTDRLVVNVAQSITFAGGTALEVLQRSPGIQVNRHAQTISLGGRQGVVLMINGQISRIPDDAMLQMLEGIAAGSIDRIEIIHTPPAGFEAEGNAGIIHIVLKESPQNGVNGSIGFNGGYGKREKWGGNGHINYRGKRINLFGRYDAGLNVNPQIFRNYRSVFQNTDMQEVEMDSHRPGVRSVVQNARIGADWEWTPKTSLGVLGTYFDRNRYISATNTAAYRTNGGFRSEVRMPNSETNLHRSFTGNMHLAHHFTKQQSIKADVDYVSFDINRPSHYTNLYLNALGQTIKTDELRIAMQTPIRVAVGKMDFESNLGKWGKIEAGSKISAMRFDNTTYVESRELSGTWEKVPLLSSDARFEETIAAAYASIHISALKNTDIIMGLRFEHTHTWLGDAHTPGVVNRRYGNWFPSFFVTHRLNEAQSLHFSYSRRIRRPQFSWLAPWLNFSDPTTFQKGNPALLPAFTDALKLTWSWKGLQVGLLYSAENQALRALSLVDATQNLQYNTYENLNRYHNAGADISFSLSPAGWWEMQNNVSLFLQATDFELEGASFRLRNAAFSLNSTQTFVLPRQFRLELSGDFDSPKYWGIARWRATGSLNVGLQKDFGRKWGKLRLNATDIFQTANWYGRTEQAEINLLVETAFINAERTFMLTWSKDFGDKRVKAARKRQTGAAEEIQRL